MAKIFECQQDVRFGHVDPAGIAYFPKIYDFIHEAFEELWQRHVGVRYYHLLQERRIGFPLVHADVDFRRPLRFGDRPLVRVTCFRLGRASLGLRYLYRVDDEVCVEARMTTACVKMDDLSTMPIPDEYRVRFAQLQEPADTAASAPRR